MAKKRILVVDDLAIFREPIAATLEAQGFKIITACNGKEALQTIQTQVHPFNLLIIDFAMPEMNGLKLIDEAKKYPQAKDASVIFLTDIADKEIVLRAYQAGAHDYILKSDFSVASLLEKVNGCLSPTSSS